MADDDKKPDEAKKPAAEKKPPAEKKPAADKKPAAKKTPANMQERMEGMQGWMAELEKKQERASRIGAIAVGLAILAAGGAIALGIMTKQDAATKDDIDELTETVNSLGASVQKQTEEQLQQINQRLGTVEQQIQSLNERQRETESQLKAVRNIANNAQTAADAASASAAAAPDSGGGSGGGSP